MGEPRETNRSKGAFNVKSMNPATLFGYMFIFPTALTLLALVLYPLLYGVYISFFKTNLANSWEFVRLTNYIQLFQDGEFWHNILITLEFTLLVVLGHFVIGMILALALNKPGKGIQLFRTILILPWLFPEVVIALVFKWIMNPLYGLLNYSMQAAGFIKDNIAWLSDGNYAFIAVVLTCIWKGFPFIMINILAGLQGVSKDIYEAATIDGASKSQTLRYITLPSLRPVLMASLVLDTVWWFKHYTIVALMTGGGPGNSTSIVSLGIFKQAFDFFNFGQAAAMSVLVFFICYLTSVLYRRFLDHENG